MQDISLQLYSARNEKSLDDVLRSLRELGYTQVEGWGGQFADPAALARSLKAAGLTMPTAHIGLANLRDTARTLDIAKTIGIKAIYCPAPATPEYWKGEGDWPALAAELAAIASALKAGGLRFGYHNHHIEFARDASGQVPMDLILAANPALEWEMDVAWVVRAGEDPVAWMDKYGSRITAIHVKDIAPKGEATDEDGWADVGHGTLDWNALLAAAKAKTRASVFVAEHDKPSDALRFARRSIASIQKMQKPAKRSGKASKTYGIGIMGAGNISTAYLKLAPLFRDLEIRAVSDIVPAAAQKRAAEFGVAAMAPDELLAHSEIDVIVNLTVPAAHFDVSLEAITAGKHVYSEKPFVLSVKEGKKLKREADRRGLYVGSAPDTFLGGAHQQVRALIDGGSLGKITHGTTHVMSRGMEHWHPNPTFFFQPGAGPILDIGPYYISDLIQLIGPVHRVTAFANSARRDRVVSTPNVPMTGRKVRVNTPTTIHGVLEFHSGAIVTIGASWDVASHGHHNIELYGTEGSVYIPDPNFFGGQVVVTDRVGKKTTVEPWDHPFGRPNFTDGNGNARANYRAAGLADMIRAIEKRRAARCGIDFALHVVDVMTSLLKAGETGRVVTLGTTCERPKALKPEDAQALLR